MRLKREVYLVAVIVYSNGKVAQMGTPQNICDNPVSSEVKALVNHSPYFLNLTNK